MLESLSTRLTILDTVREAFLASVRAASPAQQAYQPTPQSWSVLGSTSSEGGGWHSSHSNASRSHSSTSSFP